MLCVPTKTHEQTTSPTASGFGLQRVEVLGQVYDSPRRLSRRHIGRRDRADSGLEGREKFLSLAMRPPISLSDVASIIETLLGQFFTISSRFVAGDGSVLLRSAL